MIVALLCLLTLVSLYFRKLRLKLGDQRQNHLVMQCLLVGFIVGAIFAFMSTENWHRTIAWGKIFRLGD